MRRHLDEISEEGVKSQPIDRKEPERKAPVLRGKNLEEFIQRQRERDPEFRELWDQRLQEELTPRQEFGERIRNLRSDLGWSQRKLATQAVTSQNQINSIENGNANPTLDTLEKVAEALGATLNIGIERKGTKREKEVK